MLELKFRRLPSFSGIKVWGAGGAPGRSYVISFDEGFPGDGYRASWQDPILRVINWIGTEGFPSRKAAEAACQELARRGDA